MSNKQIKVYSTRGVDQQTFDVENIETFGQAKEFLTSKGVDFEGMNCTQAETRVGLQMDSSILDYQSTVAGILTCTFILTPAAQKAGN